MNKVKHLIVVLFLFFSFMSFAQGKREFNCVDKFESIKTEVESQKTISYKIISSNKLYTKDSFEFSKGIIVINDLNENLNIEEKVKVLATIGVKNKLSEIIAFKNCRAVDIYFKATITTEEINYLENNLIIELKIDLNKSLSRKEKKKNKKKRDFIESVGIEICEILAKEKVENFNQEKISNAMIPKLSENVDKMIKVYDLSFEIGSKLFMKDLTFYLIDNCKIVTDFATKNE